MKNGTLSNNVQGRYIVVWDNLIASLPDPQATQLFRQFDRIGARGKALKQWQTNVIAVRALNDLAFRRGYPVDLVTLLDKRYEQKLRARARGEDLPVSSVRAMTEDELDEHARLTIGVVGVIHPFVNRPFLFGGKGIAASGGAWSL